MKMNLNLSMESIITGISVGVITSIGWTWYHVFSHKPNNQLDDSLLPAQKKDFKVEIILNLN